MLFERFSLPSGVLRVYSSREREVFTSPPLASLRWGEKKSVNGIFATLRIIVRVISHLDATARGRRGEMSEHSEQETWDEKISTNDAVSGDKSGINFVSNHEEGGRRSVKL